MSDSRREAGMQSGDKNLKQYKELWHRILCYPLGARVRTIRQDALVPTGFMDQSPPLGSEGVIERYVEKSWKIHMVEVGCYPPEVLKETMYVVHFELATRLRSVSFAIRGQEIEVIQDE